jgi:hypothetical protein
MKKIKKWAIRNAKLVSNLKFLFWLLISAFIIYIERELYLFIIGAIIYKQWR